MRLPWGRGKGEGAVQDRNLIVAPFSNPIPRIGVIYVHTTTTYLVQGSTGNCWQEIIPFPTLPQAQGEAGTTATMIYKKNRKKGNNELEISLLPPPSSFSLLCPCLHFWADESSSPPPSPSILYGGFSPLSPTAHKTRMSSCSSSSPSFPQIARFFYKH